MARITFKAGDDYMRRLLRTSDRSEEMVKKAIDEGACIVTDEIRVNLKKNLAGSTLSTGALEKSLGTSKIRKAKNGSFYTKIGFRGYDKKHVPNALKARVMESGSSKIRKRPFVRPAVDAKRNETLEAMERAISEEIKKSMEG